MACQRRIEVESVQGRSTIFDRATWQHLKPLQQCFRLRTSVRIHPADDDIHPFSTPGMRGFEHGVRFAHASRGAKEDLEFATGPVRLFRLHTGQQSIWVGPVIVHTPHTSRTGMYI